MEAEVQTIYDQLYFSAIAIKTVDLTGRVATATGFIWHATAGELLLTTNRHVLEGARSVSASAVGGSQDGGPLRGVRATGTVQLSDVPWTAHPNPEVDVAVIPWAPFVEDMASNFSRPFVVYFDGSESYGLGSTTYVPAIAEVFFAGFPSGIYDEENKIPVVRRGITATPASWNFDALPAFLMDGPIMKGSSGSPVFFASDAPEISNDSISITGTRFAFLGVLASFKASDDGGPDAERGTDLGVVFNARAIEETVDEYYRLANA